MKRTMLAFLLAMTFMVSLVGVSLAEFDFSVFENNEEVKFDVEHDRMNDTGTITIPVDFSPFPDSTYPVVDVQMDIRSLSIGLAVIRMAFFVSGSTPNVKKIIFLPDETRYTVESVMSNVDTSYSAKHEIIAMVVTSELHPMFEEIIEKQIISVAFRLVGDKDIDGTITIDVKNLSKFMELYELAGGWEQEYFSVIDALYPVTIKELK